MHAWKPPITQGEGRWCLLNLISLHLFEGTSLSLLRSPRRLKVAGRFDSLFFVMVVRAVCACALQCLCSLVSGCGQSTHCSSSSLLLCLLLPFGSKIVLKLV